MTADDIEPNRRRQFMPHMPAGPAPQAQEPLSKLFAPLAEPLEVWAANVENLRSTPVLPHPEHLTASALFARTNSSNVAPHSEQWYS
jgi:hypothetical protein